MSGAMIRFALLFAALLLPSVAKAQTPFDPATVAYVLCVTDETKKHALATPPINKAEIVDKAFAACGDVEAKGRKSLADNGASAAVIDDRFAQLKKFIRLTTPDDIDRFRVNKVPR